MNKTVKRVRCSSDQDLFTLEESPSGNRKRDKKAAKKAKERQNSIQKFSQDDFPFADELFQAIKK